MSLEQTYAPQGYYTEGFRNVIEDHLSLLKKDPENIILEISPMLAHRYEYDVVKIFRSLKIPAEIHWVTMRMNNIENMLKLPPDKHYIVVPNNMRISKLYQVYSTAQKIN